MSNNMYMDNLSFFVLLSCPTVCTLVDVYLCLSLHISISATKTCSTSLWLKPSPVPSCRGDQKEMAKFMLVSIFQEQNILKIYKWELFSYTCFLFLCVCSIL